MTEIPKVMKALVCRQSGAPDQVLSIDANISVPAPKDGQVLIKVSHAALNPIDYKIIGSGIGFSIVTKHDGAMIPGSDLCGKVVAAVGCKRVKVGDTVIGLPYMPLFGACAEYAVVPELAVASKPESLSAAAASSFPVVAYTSQAVLEGLHLTPDSKLLILGGGSSTGAYGVQMAKQLYGLKEVTVTCGPSSVTRVKEFGADVVIDYQAKNWWEVLKGKQFDAIYDTVGGPDLFDKSKEVLKPTGVFATIVGDHPHEPLSVSVLAQSMANLALRKFVGLFSGPSYQFVAKVPPEGALEALSKSFDSPTAPKLQAYVDRVLPLEQFKEAFALLQSGHAKGKIVLQIGKD